MRIFLLILLIGSVLASCNVNKDLMFKTPQDFEFDNPTDTVETPYRLNVNDVIEFRLFANKGSRLIEFTTSQDEEKKQTNFGNVSYTVELDGTIEFPEIGYVIVAGLTIEELKDKLAELYSALYHDPFILIQVTNNRVIVYPGDGGDAMVIYLRNRNTTLIEALALAGGIAPRGNASKVKLFREKNGKTEIYRFDLSKIEGVQYMDLIVQADDIIYVEPTPQIGLQVIENIMPYVTLLSSMAILYVIFAN